MNTDTRGIRPRDIVLSFLTLGLLAGIYFGGTAVWQKYRGPSQATAADCRTAQQLVDTVQHLPKGKTALESSYAQERKTWNTISDGYLQTPISGYMSLAYAVAGNDTEKLAFYNDPADPWGKDDWDKLINTANSHCKSHKLTIPTFNLTATR
ncbi:hypothetical protein [Kineosporia sp. NBRC 101731]|uniref:hypothetical protein n=1 Tax=Kineosporia sp. NBRC 101731 TaxID=3032199 RepID=UPI0024A40A44|nr:hypothetical protein [Kineosporia sp. NBRC 101731]GLY29936.1 hypothetical protein Kisp02_33010 [Kineosporia sp. NBRC 101731]